MCTPSQLNNRFGDFHQGQSLNNKDCTITFILYYSTVGSRKSGMGYRCFFRYVLQLGANVVSAEVDMSQDYYEMDRRMLHGRYREDGLFHCTKIHERKKPSDKKISIYIYFIYYINKCMCIRSQTIYCWSAKKKTGTVPRAHFFVNIRNNKNNYHEGRETSEKGVKKRSYCRDKSCKA